MARKSSGGISKSKSNDKGKMSVGERQDLLIENFVGLQKAMINLSIKFEHLSENITKLLYVFELSAKNIVSGSKEGDNKELVEKLDSLLEQNRTIAKGLVLIEERLKNRIEMPISRGFQQRPKPLPRI